ncbi:MAG: tetratricopeptide repeat protein [Gemmatimonadota bacterium]
MGESLFSRSDYAGAARAYEEHMSVRPDDSRNDRVLLRLGVIYLVYGVPDRDPERGEKSLRELANRFPSSPLREAADYVLALRQEIAVLRSESEGHRQEVLTLESQIEALKRIDLENGDTPR